MTRPPSIEHPRGRDEVQFLYGWLRHPRRVGAILPSGRNLAAAMAHAIDIDAQGAVVELGAGTGAITRALLEAGVSTDDLILVERDPRLCRLLALRFEGTRVLCADAGDLPALLRRAGIDRVKAVVSGLPLLSMKDKERRRVIEAAFDVLAADGQFVQFTYGINEPVPGGLRGELGVAGARCQWILWNFPPATVWRYRRDKLAHPAQLSLPMGTWIPAPLEQPQFHVGSLSRRLRVALRRGGPKIGASMARLRQWGRPLAVWITRGAILIDEFARQVLDPSNAIGARNEWAQRATIGRRKE